MLNGCFPARISVHYSCWRTVSGVSANRFVVEWPSLAHRREPGVSDANNERNTFGVFNGGGGAQINVCLTKPVWVLGLTIYYNALLARLRCRRSFWPRAIVRIQIYIHDGETPLNSYHGRSINIMYFNINSSNQYNNSVFLGRLLLSRSWPILFIIFT